MVAGPKLSRRERAERTRLTVIRAAHASFVERGYTGTRMQDVAAAAGVAVQTVYFVFHTKPELLAACYDHAVLGEDDPQPPQRQAWYVALLAAGTAEESTSHFVAGNTAILERVAALDDTMRAAVHEPDAVEVHQRSHRLRREGYQAMVEHWERRFGLRTGLSADHALDLLLMLSGPAGFRELVLEDGWSVEDYRAWLHGQVLGLLGSDPQAG